MAGSAGCFIKQSKRYVARTVCIICASRAKNARGDTMHTGRVFHFCAGFALSVLLIASSAYPSCGTVLFIDRSRGLKDYDLHRVAVNPHNPGTVFVSSSSVVYVSYDGGDSWKETLSFRASGKAVNAITVSEHEPSIVYCGTDDGMYASRDRGRHWRRIFTGIGAGENSVLSVIDIPHQDGMIFAGTRAGLFWSLDKGQNWTKVRTIPSDSAVNELVRAGETFYAVTERGLFKSRGNGNEWESIYESKVYREIEEISDDHEGAPNETEPDDERGNFTLAVDPADHQRLYLGTSMGMLISADGGRTWQSAPGAGTISRDVRHLAVVPDAQEIIYAATDQGIICFSQKTGTWTNMYKGLLSPDIRDLSVYQDFRSSDHIIWAATGNGVFRSAPDRSLPDETHAPVDDVLGMFSHEPPIEEVREAAIRYAEVQPEKIERWRKAASLRAWLPDLRFSYDRNRDWQSSTYFYSTTTQKFKDDDITDGKDWAWSVSLTWELGDLIWNDAQTSIDTRSRLMAQLRDDVLSEVTRLYYERRRLQIEMALSGEGGGAQEIEDELRLQELTANIDALTGSYLSRRLGR